MNMLISFLLFFISLSPLIKNKLLWQRAAPVSFCEHVKHFNIEWYRIVLISLRLSIRSTVF